MKSTMTKLATAATTGLTLGLALSHANVASAASFDFEYTYDSGEKLTGMVDGDINGNIIENLSNLMAEYSALPGIIFDTLPSTHFLSLDGSQAFFDGTDATGNYAFSLNQFGGAGLVSVSSLTPATTYEFEPYNGSLKVTQKRATPEPTTVLPLFLLGASFLGGMKKNQKVEA